jgi:hypothetical protein
MPISLDIRLGQAAHGLVWMKNFARYFLIDANEHNRETPILNVAGSEAFCYACPSITWIEFVADRGA